MKRPGWIRGVLTAIGFLGLGLVQIPDNHALSGLLVAIGLAAGFLTWWWVTEPMDAAPGDDHRSAK
jgi:biotin transporter BioY